MPLRYDKKHQAQKTLGVYIHIPFCRSKCEYCDFYSIGGSRDKSKVDRYLQALSLHFKEAGAQAAGYEVNSVYFGGGTPSFFGAKGLIRIFNELQRRFNISPEAEITFEANPDSVSQGMLQQLRSEGFNRMSLGVQNDEDDLLKKLGRPHNYEQAINAVRMARKAGIENVSVDLMYGLPGQTFAQWQQTLPHVIDLEPDHVSCYALKIEEGTPLWDYKDCIVLPDTDDQADMYLFACDKLTELGYRQYEISNFARVGYESRHNLKYWLGEEYLGFGPSAASDFAGKRFTAVRDLDGYSEGILSGGTILAECEEVPNRERAGEYLMLRLRTVQGIDAEEYMRNFLLPFKPLEKLLERFKEFGLARQKNNRWYLSPKGMLVSNSILTELLLAQEKSKPLAKRQ